MDVGSRGILPSMQRKKGADQLHGYRAADLHLCFHMQKCRFSQDAAQIRKKVCQGKLQILQGEAIIFNCLSLQSWLLPSMSFWYFQLRNKTSLQESLDSGFPTW